MENLNDKDLIFALDIGTRSVIGIVGYKDDNIFRLVSVEKEEYTSRVVIDGQIDDIAETAITANIVKTRLEEKLGITLAHVYIAAAGRSLITEQVVAEAIVDDELISEEFVKKLEFSAVEQAIEKISAETERAYYYVGHTVQKYILDDYDLKSLVEHKGHLARAFMIVTFLPQEVVESLCATMKRIGLKISGLTLEPIAAMNVIIPNEIRKLNLALCDIGAGTSDIAICKHGSVIGYTMATMAGDEITETIMENCLVDFNEAERIKFELSGTGTSNIEYINVLGLEDSMSRLAIVDFLSTTVKKLADTICDRIVEMNGEAPAAIFLSGGGSQTPFLSEYIARKLDIADNKVAIGSNIYMKKLVESDHNVFTPEFATPLGIAVTAMQEVSSNTFSVKVNDQSIHLFNLVDTSVYAILQVSGHRYLDLIGTSGKNLAFTLNGHSQVIRGTISAPAEIYLNDKVATLTDIVLPGDNLRFNPAKSGEDGRCFVSDIAVSDNVCTITVNGKNQYVGMVIKINGNVCDINTEILDGDEVTTENIQTLAHLRAIMPELSEDFDVYVNNILCADAYVFCDGDAVHTVARRTTPKATRISMSTTRVKNITQEKPKTVIKTEIAPVKEVEKDPYEDLFEELHAQASELEEKEKKSEIKEELFEEILDNEIEEEIEEIEEIPPKPPIFVTLNGRQTLLEPKSDGSKYLFLDMLNFTDIDPKNPQGDIYLRVNGEEPTYLQEIMQNDVIEIRWKN